jgi:hypothetical protein
MIARLLNYEDTLENKFLKFNQILAARLHFFNYDQAVLLPDLAPRFVISATPFLPDFKKSHKSCQSLGSFTLANFAGDFTLSWHILFEKFIFSLLNLQA